MAEGVDCTAAEKVLLNRSLLRGIDTYDRERAHEVSTSQRFTEGCNVTHLEQQRNIVEYTAKESKADTEGLTGYSPGAQMHDIQRYKASMDNQFYSSGMMGRYANQNPETRS